MLLNFLDFEITGLLSRTTKGFEVNPILSGLGPLSPAAILLKLFIIPAVLVFFYWLCTVSERKPFTYLLTLTNAFYIYCVVHNFYILIG